MPLTVSTLARCLTGVAVALTAALLVGTAVADSSRARSCGGITFTPRTEDAVYTIRAVGVSCKTARRVARAVRPLGIVEGPYQYRQSGFRCVGRYIDENIPVVKWRCTKARARITFDRA